MERWLSLKVQDVILPQTQSPAPSVRISVPKRTVKNAVRRNRIKRVLREAVRRDDFFSAKKIYLLKVLRMPADLDLGSAQKILGELHD